MSGWVPDSLHGYIGVVAGHNSDISRSCVAQNSVVAKKVDIDIRDGSRICRRIGEVDHRLDGQGIFGRIDDLEVSNRVVERWKPAESRSLPGSFAARDGYCKRSLARESRELIFGLKTHV